MEKLSRINVKVKIIWAQAAGDSIEPSQVRRGMVGMMMVMLVTFHTSAVHD